MRYLYFVCLLLKLLLLFLLSNSAKAQPTTVAQADSLQFVLRNSKPDTNRVEALLKLSDFYINKTIDPKRDLDSALVLVRQAEELVQQLGFSKGWEEALFLKCKIYIKTQNTGIVLKMLESMADTNRIKVLLEMGKYRLKSTYAQEANLDSALIFFRQAEAISGAIDNQKLKEESLSLIGVSYLLREWPRGKAIFMQVIQSRKRDADKSGEMRAWLRLATTKLCDDCEENIRALGQALALCHQIGDKALEAIILLEMGYKYLGRGNTMQAERYALLALAIQETIGFRVLNQAYHALTEESFYYMPGDYGYLSNAYYLFSDLSQEKGDLNKKLFYILKAVKTVESSGMLEELDYPYFRLGNTYWELGEFDKSIAYHQQSLAISHRKGEVFVQIGLPRRMTIALIKQEKAEEALNMLQEIVGKNLPLGFEDKMFLAQSFGACYSALKQYNMAEKYYLESIAWSKQSALQFHYVAWQRISQFYVATGQYTKADPYLKLLLTALHEQIIPNHLMEVHLMRFKVDSALANYPSAIKHYQQYKALNDSIFNESKTKQIAQLSIQYETDKKEHELKLKEQNIALLTEKSKLQQTQRNALICGIAFLLAMLGLSYNRYRLKQHSNRQLQAQQEELQAQHEELQAQQDELQAQQQEINHKNVNLSQLLTEKDSLLLQKDTLLEEKDLLLIEKEWLLKEIHHRVKNNLQVVMSLLDSQADSLKDKAALSAIQESQHRVQAMALIHQKLYQSESLARIPMSSYIEEVVAYLHDSYSPYQPIRIELSVEDIELDVTLAVPLGLIINEAITNAYKYAFPNERTGTITVRLHSIKETSYKLVIADDGVGLPANYDPSHSRSLGMTLIHGFSRQLGGKLSINSPSGMCISLLFAEAKFMATYSPANHS